jgi:hypothetical protein
MMTANFFFDEDGYYAYCSAGQNVDDTWSASVLFERIADHAKTLVPAVRHKLRDKYPDSKTAIHAASEFASECIQKQATGLS